MNSITCLKCEKPFKNILLHLNKNSICRNHYSQESFDELTKQCKKLARDQKNLKRRQNYDPQAESERQKLKYDAAKESVRNKTKYVHQLSTRKESMKTFNQKMFLDFFEEIKFGPIFPCICCMKCFTLRGVRIANTNFVEKLQNLEMTHCIDTNERLKINGNFHLCHTCHLKLPKKQMPKLCFKNGLELSPVPPCLQISALGNQLIAKYILFIKIRKTSKKTMDIINDRVS